MEYHRWDGQERAEREEEGHDTDHPKVEIHTYTHAAEIADGCVHVAAQPLVPDQSLPYRDIRKSNETIREGVDCGIMRFWELARLVTCST